MRMLNGRSTQKTFRLLSLFYSSEYIEDLCPYATFQLNKQTYSESSYSGNVYSGPYHSVRGSFVYHDNKDSYRVSCVCYFFITFFSIFSLFSRVNRAKNQNTQKSVDPAHAYATPIHKMFNFSNPIIPAQLTLKYAKFSHFTFPSPNTTPRSAPSLTTNAQQSP